MKRCKKCGVEIEEEARFCSSCGAKVEGGENPASNPPDYNASKKPFQNSTELQILCCPRCGNKDLQVTTELGGIVSGGVYNSGKFGGISVASNDTYWICRNCGKKFKNPDGIREDVKAFKRFANVFDVFGIVGGFVMFVLLLILGEIIWAFVADVITLGIFLLIGIPFKIWASRSEKSLYELEEGMGRFQNQ